jgi:hypothetical protein
LPSLRIMKLWRRKLSLRNPGTPSYQILAEIISISVIVFRIFATRISHNTVGYNDFDFLEKIKSLDPLMDAKLNSKTNLLNSFVDFWSRFVCVWPKSLKKVPNILICIKKRRI